MAIRSTKVLKQGQAKKVRQVVSGFPLIQFISNGFTAGSPSRKQILQQFNQTLTASEQAHDGHNRVRPRKG